MTTAADEDIFAGLEDLNVVPRLPRLTRGFSADFSSNLNNTASVYDVRGDFYSSSSPSSFSTNSELSLNFEPSGKLSKSEGFSVKESEGFSLPNGYDFYKYKKGFDQKKIVNVYGEKKQGEMSNPRIGRSKSVGAQMLHTLSDLGKLETRKIGSENVEMSTPKHEAYIPDADAPDRSKNELYVKSLHEEASDVESDLSRENKIQLKARGVENKARNKTKRSRKNALNRREGFETPTRTPSMSIVRALAENIVPRSLKPRSLQPRVRRACYTCRKAKTKCDNHYPCKRCVKLGHPHLCAVLRPDDVSTFALTVVKEHGKFEKYTEEEFIKLLEANGINFKRREGPGKITKACYRQDWCVRPYRHPGHCKRKMTAGSPPKSNRKRKRARLA
mmetsp:Transcript_18575/g.27807  ORF Transcript_18575/g.27807 Transcript_18575/m.27807 type:complete len:389 (-) Transcript_18575:204-1370(-)